MTQSPPRGRVLLLSPSYPPYFSADTLQAWMMAEGLSGVGWDVHVFGAGVFERYPTDLSIPLNATVPVTRIPPLPRALQGLARVTLSRERRVRHQAELFQRRGERILRHFRPTHILSLYGAGHLAGCTLAGRADAVFVPYFIDPFRRNLYRDDSPRAASWYDAQMEHIVRAAARIIFPTQEMAEEELKPFPGALAKVIVVPHGVSRRFVPAACTPLADAEIITAAHIGNLYGKRRLRPLLEALDILRDRAPEVYGHLRIDLYSPIPAPDRAHAHEHAQIFRLRSFLPYSQLVQQHQQYHFLFLIEPPVIPYNNLTSKLLEALAQGKTVFGISPPASVGSGILRARGHYAADVFSPEDIARKLIQITDDLRDDPSRSCREIVHDYDDDRLTERLDAALRAASATAEVMTP